MDKKGILVIIGIIAAVIIAANFVSQTPLFSVTAGSTVVYSDCATALQKLYNGAQPGQCLVSGTNTNPTSVRNAPQYLWYVESAVDGQAGGCLGSGISPACPDGYRHKCTITISHDYADTLQCTEAVSAFGDMNCANGYCDYKSSVSVPSSCNVGECLDVSESQHVECLSNGKFSGRLSGACPTGSNTDTGNNQNQNTNTNQDTGTNPTPTPNPISNTVWIIGGLSAAAVAILLLKK